MSRIALNRTKRKFGFQTIIIKITPFRWIFPSKASIVTGLSALRSDLTWPKKQKRAALLNRTFLEPTPRREIMYAPKVFFNKLNSSLAAGLVALSCWNQRSSTSLARKPFPLTIHYSRLHAWRNMDHWFPLPLQNTKQWHFEDVTVSRQWFGDYPNAKCEKFDLFLWKAWSMIILFWFRSTNVRFVWWVFGLANWWIGFCEPAR